MKWIFSMALILITSLQAEGLSPGDMVKLSVFRYEELSGKYSVGDDGTIYLPLVGKIDTENLDIDSLRDIIRLSYSIYIANPQILIVPLYRITVLGEVRMSGLFYVSGRERLARLIAMAGGLTVISDINRAYIMRDGERIKAYLDSEVISGDIIYIPRQWWPTWPEWSTMLSTIAIGFSLYMGLR